MRAAPTVLAVRDEIRALDTSPHALRQFGVLVGGVFALAAAWLGWRSGGAAWTLALGGAALGLVALGLAAPRVLRGPYRAWMALGVVLGAVTSRVLLTAVFALVVTPIGLALRALGRTPLALRPDPAAETYWEARDAAPPDPARVERDY